MKKLTLLFLGAFCMIIVSAQTKNGTIYAEHELIEKTRQVWKAFAESDQETYLMHFADSLKLMRNGEYFAITKEEFGSHLGWWKENIVDLAVSDDEPAYPDAIEYKDGGKWVQDWLMLSGTHQKSGIKLDLRIHNLYAFDDDGKIAMLIQYYNNDVFEAIDRSGTVRENGKVYINHPYISTVRKMTNAYAAKDLETFLSFYDDAAEFSSASMDWNESIDITERKKAIQENFASLDAIHFKQIGYPDCIYYEITNDYVVYSWWEYSFTIKETGQKVTMPLMLSHSFDDNGKVVFEISYYSTNHLEDK